MGAPVVSHRTDSAQATEAVGAELARTLRGGECIAMYGDLGAGKTQIVRGLVRGVGGPVRRVSSPTFVLLNIYEGGRLTVYHLDAYRVSAADFEGIGFAELLEQPGAVVAVEWAERVAELLPKRRIEVRIESVDEAVRIIEIATMAGQ